MEGSAHPDLEAEQAYIDNAYASLDLKQEGAAGLAEAAARSFGGGTFQSRYERDVTIRTGLHRREQLDIGDESLCFGRIDHIEGERYYVGRRGVLSAESEPLVIDWRVPAAEPFYRATGLHPMGLEMRRHLICHGRTLAGIEDERFSDDPTRAELGLSGMGALVSALERPRSGRMRDIVATVQSEQDEIIRADIGGVLAVQGGPGTGKTAVALHRAAYLLFTHRARLQRQRVLIVGPNRLFLRYIEQVLPALGESGAKLATIADLVAGARVSGVESPDVARLKGDVRMVRFIQRAVTHHQRALGRDLVVEYEGRTLVLGARYTAGLIKTASRSRRPHNRRRAMLHGIMTRELLDRYIAAEGAADPMLPATIDRKAVREDLRDHPALVAGLEEMWPSLTPQALMRSTFGSADLLARCGRGIFSDDERALLLRPANAGWTTADVPLFDEAFVLLGATRSRGRTRERDDAADEAETYGHILVDEIQDFPPMALRMFTRRSRTGSMTVVGDLAQAVGAWTPESWDQILEHLPTFHAARVSELSVNYRTPSEIMEYAQAILSRAAPGVKTPSAVRSTGEPPGFIETDDAITAAAARAASEVAEVAGGTVAVLCAPSMLEELARALSVTVVTVEAEQGALDDAVTLAEIDTVKGLEFDSVVVVEPARILREHAQGLRALYVAFTRSTKRLSVVHAEPLPEPISATSGPSAPDGTSHPRTQPHPPRRA